MQTNTTDCVCGNCPAHRMARGLKPFCRIPAPVSQALPLYNSKAEAEAANPGQAVHQLRGFNAPKSNFQNCWTVSL